MRILKEHDVRKLEELFRKFKASEETISELLTGDKAYLVDLIYKITGRCMSDYLSGRRKR